MIEKTVIRIALSVVLAWTMGSACASKTEGTDSNTHWVTCGTVADCPDGGAYLCLGGRCVNAPDVDSGGPVSSGVCPNDVGPNVPCDGKLSSCLTECAGGYQSSWTCNSGHWVGTLGLYPCGPDASTRGNTGGSSGTANSGGSPTGGTSGGNASGGSSTGGAGASTGGRADAGPDAAACAPMDAHNGNRPCTSILGYTWTGADCAPIACTCVGTECASLYPSDIACRQARSSCLANVAVSYACLKNSDCMLADQTCCGKCGGDVSLADKAAINVGSFTTWHGDVCGTQPACPPCVPVSGPFQAVCDQTGMCRTEDFSAQKACTRDADCIAQPVDCCPCGQLTDNDVTALKAPATFPPCVVTCVACPGGYQLPPDVHAVCDLSGHYCTFR